MATRRPTSYRRNRDYAQHFEWTYELNKDVYDCYVKARSNPAIGYMRQLKQYWDEKLPQYNYLY